MENSWSNGGVRFPINPPHFFFYFSRSILKKGGSAVDGAIAALLCTSVVNPQSMGIGGGSIVTVRNKAGSVFLLFKHLFPHLSQASNADLFPGHVKVYNFRETVPRKFKVDLLSDCPSTFRMSTGEVGLAHHHLFADFI